MKLYMKVLTRNTLLATLGILIISGGMLRLAFAEDQKIMLFPNNLSHGNGTRFTLTLDYDVSDGDNTLSGLDVSVHFDSSKITYNHFSDFLNVGDLKAPPTLLDDTQDEDSDPNTDKRINMSWSSFSLEWPNVELPAALAKLNFSVNDNAKAGDTSINISVYDWASGAGYGVALTNATITIGTP